MYQKCTDLSSIYHRFEQEICMLFTQYLFKSWYQTHFAYFEYKKVMCVLLGATRRVFGHQNTGHRTEASLKRRHCVILEYSFIFRHTKLTMFLFAALSKGTEVMVHQADRPRCCNSWPTIWAEVGRAANSPFPNWWPAKHMYSFAGLISIFD